MTTRREAAVQALAMLRDMGVTMTKSRPAEGDDFCAKYLRLVARRERTWFLSRLRARTPDRDRSAVKAQRSARAVRLFAFWWFAPPPSEAVDFAASHVDLERRILRAAEVLVNTDGNGTGDAAVERCMGILHELVHRLKAIKAAQRRIAGAP